MTTQPPQLVAVRWRDSVGIGGWRSAEEARYKAADESSMGAETVGYLLAQTDAYVLLAMGRMSDGDLVHDTMQIPAEAVVSIDPLRRR